MLLGLTSGSPLVEAAWALGIVVTSSLVAWFIVFSLHYVQHRLEGKRRTALLPQMLQHLTRPIALLIFLEGLIFAMSTLSYLQAWNNIHQIRFL